MAKVTVSFTLDTERDARVIRWLRALPRGRKSEAIRGVLDSHLGRKGVTLGDVYQAVKALEAQVRAAGVPAPAGQPVGPARDEPPDAATNLDRLGL